MTDHSPLVAALLAEFRAADADYARAARRSGRTLALVLADMEAVARAAHEARGLVQDSDFLRAGRSINGLVEEPLVAGMAPAFSPAEIARFAPRVCALLALEFARLAEARRRRDGARRDARLARAAQFVLGLVGGASGVAGIAHLAGLVA